jgi:uncharacterized protein YcbK (DUF882 family)
MSHQLTSHFAWEEFDCKDGTKVPQEYWGNVQLLATNLEALRRAFDKPIQIVSGFRTKAHNKAVGGAPSSQHLTASAADIKIEGHTPKEVAAKIEALVADKRMTQGGIGIYPTWVHYDIRGVHARW